LYRDPPINLQGLAVVDQMFKRVSGCQETILAFTCKRWYYYQQRKLAERHGKGSRQESTTVEAIQQVLQRIQTPDLLSFGLILKGVFILVYYIPACV
jgi:hypothetical protein